MVCQLEEKIQPSGESLLNDYDQQLNHVNCGFRHFRSEFLGSSRYDPFGKSKGFLDGPS